MKMKPAIKIMKAVLVLSLSCFAVTAFSQTSLRKGPEINGIRLGATQPEVIRRFGKPTARSTRKADECVGGTEMTIGYPGIKFLLWDNPEDPKKFDVGGFEVTRSKWSISGAKIGQTAASVRKLFGEPSSREGSTRSGRSVFYYEMDDEAPGSTAFHFRNGRLVKVTSQWLMC